MVIARLARREGRTGGNMPFKNSTATLLIAIGAAALCAGALVSLEAQQPAPGGRGGGRGGAGFVLGWTANHQAVPACLGGSFFVISGGQPGSGATTPVTGTTYGYGVYDDAATTWTNADGYLPALVTTL